MALKNTVINESPTDVYVSAGASAVTFMSLCNYSAGTVTVDVFLVPLGEPVSNGTLFIKQIEITPSDTYEVYHAAEKLVLGNGDKIVAVASTDESVTAIVSYVEV